MSLSDQAKAARAHADQCTNRACHGLALALEGALAAEARECLNQPREEPAAESFPSPAESGYPREIKIPRGGTEN